MKLIHCADIHLGSPLTANLDRDTAESRNNEITLAFERIAEYAKANDIAAVIIAGDLFDRKIIRASIKDTVIKCIKDAPNVDFLYLKGNHDKATAFPVGNDIPTNLKLFAEDWTAFDYGEITISGVRLTEDNCRGVYNSLDLKAGRTNIVVMHGGISKASVKDTPDTINLKKLQNKNIDYLALGDYHSYQYDKLDMRGNYCYSGCPEGRGFDETGEKGFVLLNCERGNVAHRFIPFCKRIVHEINVDIGAAASYADIESLVYEAIQDVKAKDLLRVNLTGAIAAEVYKNLTYLQQKLNEDFYYAEVQDKTRRKIDPSSYADGVSLKSEFIKLVLADTSLSEETREKIIGCGIAALRGEKPEL